MKSSQLLESTPKESPLPVVVSQHFTSTSGEDLENAIGLLQFVPDLLRLLVVADDEHDLLSVKVRDLVTGHITDIEDFLGQWPDPGAEE